MHKMFSLKKGQCDMNVVRVKKKLFPTYFYSLASHVGSVISQLLLTLKIQTLTMNGSSHTDKLTLMKTQNMKNYLLECCHLHWFQLLLVINSIISFQVSESAVFNEITLEKYVDEKWKHWLKEETQESECIQN
jgi:hypothetical protein